MMTASTSIQENMRHCALPPNLSLETPQGQGKEEEDIDGDQYRSVPIVKRRRFDHSVEYCDQLENAMLKKIENELELIKVEVEKAKELAKLELEKKRSLLALELSLSVAAARKKLKEEGCNETEIEALVAIPSSFSTECDYDVSIDRYFTESKPWHVWNEFTRILAADYPSLLFNSLEFQRTFNPYVEKITKDSLKRVLKHQTMEQMLRPFRLVVGDVNHVERELRNRMGSLSSDHYFCMAIEGKHWDLVDAMINSNIQTCESLEQKLVASAKSGNANLCRLFLDLGAKPRGVAGELPPLFYAVQLDHTEMVSLLFRRGAKIPKHSNGDNSELHIAAKKGNIAISQMLIENGADVNAFNGNTEWTPIHEAAAGGKIEMCQFLVHNYNCDLDLLTATGKRAFDLARIGGHSSLGAYLKSQWEAQNARKAERGDELIEKEPNDSKNQMKCNELAIYDAQPDKPDEKGCFDDQQNDPKPEQDHIKYQESDQKKTKDGIKAPVLSGRNYPNRMMLMSCDEPESDWNQCNDAAESLIRNHYDDRERISNRGDDTKGLGRNNGSQLKELTNDREETDMEEGEVYASFESSKLDVEASKDENANFFIHSVDNKQKEEMAIDKEEILAKEHVYDVVKINDKEPESEVGNLNDIKEMQFDAITVEKVASENSNENINESDVSPTEVGQQKGNEPIHIPTVCDAVLSIETDQIPVINDEKITSSANISSEKIDHDFDFLENDKIHEEWEDAGLSFRTASFNLEKEKTDESDSILAEFTSSGDTSNGETETENPIQEIKSFPVAVGNQDESLKAVQGKTTQDIVCTESKDQNTREAEEIHDSDLDSVSVSSCEDLYPDLPVFKCTRPN